MPDEAKVLDNLDEDEAYLFAILSDISGLDQAEFLWVDHSSEDNLFCPECGIDGNGAHLHEHPDIPKQDWVQKYPAPSVCFRAWAFQWPWWRTPLSLQIDQCVAEGQLVLTSTGWRPIESVQVGEYVLTHLGRWRMVTGVADRGEREVVSVRGYGHNGLRVTPDHRLVARRSRRASAPRDGHKGKVLNGPEWMTPEQWEWNDGSGTMVANWYTAPGLVEPLSVPQMVPCRGTRNLVPDVLAPEWLWLYGLFLAEGSTYIGTPPDLVHRVVWSVHRSEADEVERVLAKVGLNWCRDDRSDALTCLSVNSRPMAEWLQREGGHRAPNKAIAPWVFGLDEARRQAVFDGAAFGDGHFRANGRVDYTTVSRGLAFGMKILGATLGYSASIHSVPAKEATIQGRRVQCREKFSVGLQTLAGQRRPRAVLDAGAMWGPVSEIAEAGTAHVYDLEVDEDESFLVEGVAVHNCARSVGKSLSIKVRGCAFPFLHAGQEMIITAPELVHLEPIVSLIESQMTTTRTLREMLPRGRSAVTHRPFQLNFLNGARIIGRIPQRDGKGVKGIHPIWLELDEAQDYPHAGWVELNETLKRGWSGAMWRAHGVTRGVRDDFYESTQDSPDNPWKVHRFAAMWRPNWSDQERQEAIQKYGTREDPDYRRNVLGLHGDKTNPIFVLTQLMRNVDNDSLSDYNTVEYMKYTVKAEQLDLFEQEISEVLDFPPAHLSYAGKTPVERQEQPKAHYWVGMDVGFTIDPSEILIFVEHRRKSTDPQTILKLLTRISMTRMPHRQQIMAILEVIDFYRPRAFALDKGGNGLPLFQELTEHIDAFRARDMDKVPLWMQQYDLETALTTIKGYNFAEKLVVELDPTVDVSPYADQEEIVKQAGMKRNAKEYATDVLREMVDRQQLWLPWDDDLLKQFQGGTWTSNKSMDAYGRRIFSRGNDHVLDAARQMALAWAQHSIEEMTKKRPVEPVFDAFVLI